MMKRFSIVILICFFTLYSFSSASSQDVTIERIRTTDSLPGWGTALTGEIEEAEYYIIMPGDVIEVIVWRNADLSREVMVRSNGKIYYPPVGAIQAVGLTVEKLQEKIEEGLAEYITSPTRFRIEAGDVIEISVWKNEELSREITVGGDGKISYPLVGVIKAAGLTPQELQEKIKKGLAEYVISPIDFRIETGDVLEIFVWRNPDLSKQVTVMDDGKISYPLVGVVKAAGSTTEELQNRLKEGLSKYIKFPDITISVKKSPKRTVLESEDVVISIKKFNENKVPVSGKIVVEIVRPAGNKIIIFGEVPIQGIYLYTGGINLLEAIAMAGGVKSTGKRDSVIVVSGNMTECPEVRRVNLFRALRKGASRKKLFLKPNDVIYIPRTFIADINKFYTELQPTLDQAMSIFDWRDKLRPWYKHWDKGIKGGD